MTYMVHITVTPLVLLLELTEPMGTILLSVRLSLFVPRHKSVK